MESEVYRVITLQKLFKNYKILLLIKPSLSLYSGNLEIIKDFNTLVFGGGSAGWWGEGQVLVLTWFNCYIFEELNLP